MGNRITDIYGMKKNVKKSKEYAGMVHQAPNTLTLIDKVEHGRRRRVISQGLSTQMIRSYEPKILKHAQKMCLAIRRGEVDIPLLEDGVKARPLPAGEWSEPIDMSKMCKYSL
jgi:cytochrome P450